MIKSKKDLNQKRERYGLASASNRIFARLIDFLIVIVFSFCFACLIFLTDLGFKGDFITFEVTEPYRYFLFGIIISIFWFTYFVILPYLWNGQTLGLKAFKLAIYNVIFSHFFTNIFKRELLVWVINSLINLFFTITLFIIGTIKGSNEAFEIIKQMYKYANNSPYFPIVIVFTTLYLFCTMLLILVFFSVVFNNKKQCLIDRISNTVTVKKIDVSGSDKQNDYLNKKSKLPKRNFNLPGVILDNPHDEILGDEE